MFFDNSNEDKDVVYHFLIPITPEPSQVQYSSYQPYYRGSHSEQNASLYIAFPKICPCCLKETEKQIKVVIKNHVRTSAGNLRSHKYTTITLHPYCADEGHLDRDLPMYIEGTILHIFCYSKEYATQFMNLNGDANCYIIPRREMNKMIASHHASNAANLFPAIFIGSLVVLTIIAIISQIF